MTDPHLEATQPDRRVECLIDLTVRIASGFAILAIRPLGSSDIGFWPTLVIGLVVSTMAAGAVWYFSKGRFEPIRGLLEIAPIERTHLLGGVAAGMVTMYVLVRMLAVPVYGQRLVWDDGMVAVALVVCLSVYVGLVTAVATRRPQALPETPMGGDVQRPFWAQLVDLVRARREDDARAWLAGESDGSALTILTALSHSSDPDIRAWTVHVARDRLGSAAGPVLEGPARADTRIDIQDEAVDQLLILAPDRAPEFWPAVRQRLKSDSQWDVERAGWRLLHLRDPKLGELIGEVLRRWPDTDYVQKSFHVLRWCVEKGHGRIVSAIDDHDHVLMPWLIRAAFSLEDPAVWAAIARAADTATDHRVRRYCLKAIRDHQLMERS